MELRQIIFQSAAELATRTPDRQQVRVDRELDQVGLLPCALAQLVVHHFQMSFGMDANGIDPATNLDHGVAKRDGNARQVLLGADENVLPVLEPRGSASQ